MLRRKNLLAHLDSPLSLVGVLMLLAISAYIFLGLFLVGTGAYWIGAALLLPVLAVVMFLALREWSKAFKRFPRIGKTMGILNAILIAAVFVYIGVLFYGAPKV